VRVVRDFAVAVQVLCVPRATTLWRRPRVASGAGTGWRPKLLQVLRYAVARRGPPRMAAAV
jgi:hypothetical protein